MTLEGKSENVEVANCSKKGRKYGKCPPCTLTYAAKKESIVRGKLPCGVQYIFFVKVALISLNYTTPNEKPWQSQDVIFKGIPSVLMGKVSSGLQYHYHPRSVWIILRGAQRAEGRRQNIDFPLNFYITPEGEIQHINFGMHFCAWRRETQKVHASKSEYNRFKQKHINKLV